MKILVIQLRRIGDIILTTPALAYLKKVYPDAQIDFLCEPMGRSVLETHPLIHDLLIYNANEPWQEIKRIRARRYDLIFDFMNNPRSSMLAGLSGATVRVAYQKSIRQFFYTTTIPEIGEAQYVPYEKIYLIQKFLAKIGVAPVEPASYIPYIYVKAEDQLFADQWMKQEDLTERSFAVIVPIHRHKIRQWNVEKFRDVGLKIHSELKKSVYISYGPGEEDEIKPMLKGYEDVLKLFPPTTIRQMAAIFQKSALVLTNDSGAMHTAVAVGTPTVTIYGPTKPANWNPSTLPEKYQSPLHTAVTVEDVKCLGCHLSECPIGHLCMENLGAEKVYLAVRKTIEGI